MRFRIHFTGVRHACADRSTAVFPATFDEANDPTCRSARSSSSSEFSIVAGAAWYYRSHRTVPNGETLPIYYTKLDGTSLAVMRVSLRPRQADETDAEHRHNVALYAAVQALAGPPSDIPAIHFPAGTRASSVILNGSTATVDLSAEVTQQAGGSFGETGSLKRWSTR